MCREDARHPGSDDRHRERPRRSQLVGAPLRRTEVVAGDRQFLAHQGHVVGVDRLADRERHQPTQSFGVDVGLGGLVVERPDAVADLDQHVDGDPADLGGLLGCEPGALVADHRPVGTDGLDEQRVVAGRVCQCREQRRQEARLVSTLDGGADLVVGCGDRFDPVVEQRVGHPTDSCFGCRPRSHRTSSTTAVIVSAAAKASQNASVLLSSNA